MAALCTSTWGAPTATKNVLLIHGILGSSQFWYRIAHEFASRGYFVTAPDLLGHGNARRSSDCTITAFVEELLPLFTAHDRPYQIIVGYSLGGVIASALLPLLKSAQPVHVVLVDPSLEMTPEIIAHRRKIFGDIARNPKTPEAHLQESPLFTREDAIFRSMSERLCDATTVEAILDPNVPWSFSHQLLTVPDKVKVTILAADPSRPPSMKVEEDVKPHPRVTAKIVWGSSHLMPIEFPHVIVETALEGTEAQNQ